MGNLVFQAVTANLSKPIKLLTWDQIGVCTGETNKLISKISLICKAGEVAVLEVQYYKVIENINGVHDSHIFDPNGDIEQYYVGSVSSEQILLPIILFDNTVKEKNESKNT